MNKKVKQQTLIIELMNQAIVKVLKDIETWYNIYFCWMFNYDLIMIIMV